MDAILHTAPWWLPYTLIAEAATLLAIEVLDIDTLNSVFSAIGAMLTMAVPIAIIGYVVTQ